MINFYYQIFINRLLVLVTNIIMNLNSETDIKFLVLHSLINQKKTAGNELYQKIINKNSTIIIINKIFNNYSGHRQGQIKFADFQLCRNSESVTTLKRVRSGARSRRESHATCHFIPPSRFPVSRLGFHYPWAAFGFHLLIFISWALIGSDLLDRGTHRVQSKKTMSISEKVGVDWIRFVLNNIKNYIFK